MHATTEAVFRIDGDTVIPSDLARGPWNPDAQHGGAPAGLIARLLEHHIDDPGHHITRVTIELLRPVPLTTLTTRVSGTAGRITGRWEATIRSGDKPVIRAHALSLKTTQLDHAIDSGDRLPFPEDATPLRIPGMPDQRSFYYTAMQARLSDGTVTEPGPATVWFRLAHPLVDGEGPSPLARTLAAADFASGISWVLPFGRYLYLNADLSTTILRPARGEWIGVQARTTIHPNGIGQTTTTLHDADGPIGNATQTLVVAKN